MTIGSFRAALIAAMFWAWPHDPRTIEAAAGPVHAQSDLHPEGRVTDAAGILSPEEEEALDAKLADFERDTQHQLVVVTMPSLNGQDVADAARDLGNRWGIGREEFDDGVVFLIAPNDESIRIAVGFGLEDILTEQLCRKILIETVLPRFENDDLAGGISAGIDAIIWELRRQRSSLRPHPGERSRQAKY